MPETMPAPAASGQNGAVVSRTVGDRIAITTVRSPGTPSGQQQNNPGHQVSYYQRYITPGERPQASPIAGSPYSNNLVQGLCQEGVPGAAALGAPPQTLGGFAARILLGALPPDPRWGLPPPDPRLGSAPDPTRGSRPLTRLLKGVWGGVPTGSGAAPVGV